MKFFDQISFASSFEMHTLQKNSRNLKYSRIQELFTCRKKTSESCPRDNRIFRDKNQNFILIIATFLDNHIFLSQILALEFSKLVLHVSTILSVNHMMIHWGICQYSLLGISETEIDSSTLQNNLLNASERDDC